MIQVKFGITFIANKESATKTRSNKRKETTFQKKSNKKYLNHSKADKQCHKKTIKVFSLKQYTIHESFFLLEELPLQETILSLDSSIESNLTLNTQEEARFSYYLQTLPGNCCICPGWIHFCQGQREKQEDGMILKFKKYWKLRKRSIGCVNYHVQ